MLKLFRSIRKKLIEQDNIRKYLLYAIGEILLVVIGILIALQVNNWNEERLINNQLETYFIQIHDELKSDLERVNKEIESLESVVMLNKRSLNLLKSDHPDSLKQLQFTLGALVTAFTISYNYPVMQEFINNGFLAKVNSEALKLKLNEVHGLLSRTKEINPVVHDQYIQTIEPYIIETFNYQSIALDRYQKFLVKGGPAVDFTQFKDDLVLWNLITLKLEISSLDLRDHIHNRDRITELIDLLNNQLEN